MFRRLMQAPPTPEEASLINQREALASLGHLLGRQGVATTPLLPSGKARFDEELVDVIADGEVVDRNQPVVVVEVRGNRVLVRQVS
jgi:membrane-bound ClpP family serine protease